MNVEYFLDTNILVYAMSGSSEDSAKRSRSIELIEAGNFGISAQVLQELYVTVTRKARLGVSAALALEWVELLAVQPCVTIDASLVMRSIEISVRYKTSYWDGAIIAAAEALGAPTILSEDLSHGQKYEGVRVVNPYLA
jgi:predicted nucleic acid-binding protein